MENVARLICKVSKSHFIAVLDMSRDYWQAKMGPVHHKCIMFKSE